MNIDDYTHETEMSAEEAVEYCLQELVSML